MDERDPALEKAWRAHSREEPPAALDAAILAAAHRAVASGPRNFTAEATRPPRWWMPLAAAAVIGVVAIGVVQLAPPEPPALDTSSSLPSPAQQLAEEKVAAAKPAQPAASESANVMGESVTQPKKQSADTPPPTPETRSEVRAKAKVVAPPPPTLPLESRQSKRDAPPPDPFPADRAGRKLESTDDKRTADGPRDAGRFAEQSPAPAARPAAPPALAQDADAGARKDAATERQLAAAPPPPAAAAPAPAPIPAENDAQRMREPARAQAEGKVGAAGAMSQLAKSATPVRDEARKNAQDPEAWIARIRKLRDDGNAAEALRELREFRALVPDAERRLPADLREWTP